jgi:hypothetical protein
MKYQSAKALAVTFLALTASGGPDIHRHPPRGSRPPKPGTGVDLPEGVSRAWWAAVQPELAKAEYALSPAGGEEAVPSAYLAPNRRHGFHTSFSKEGVRVRLREDQGPELELSLRLRRVGAGEGLHAVPEATLRAERHRAEYVRGTLTEWYVNDARGLEQGFTLQEPPAGAAPFAPIRLELEVAGDLAPRLEGGDAVVLEHHGEARLRYAGLRSWDARGRDLPSRLELREEGGGGARLALVVEAAGAEYPVTVDPIVTSPAWTAYGGETGAQFGGFVASAGDVNGDGYGDVLVGAPYYDGGQADSGRAFLFQGSPSGPSITPDWVTSGGQAGELHGVVAGAGDVNGDGYADVIVGAPGFSNGETNEGRVAVYLGSAAGLAAVPAFTAEGNQAAAGLGASVAGAGDVNGDGYADVIAGAPNHDNPEVNEGRVYVFMGSAAGPAGAPWTAESNQASALFGSTVAGAADVNGDGYSDVVAAAPYWDQGFVDRGRVFVYHGSGAGLPGSPTRTLDSPVGQNDAHFGQALAGAGDVNGDGFSDVIVGTPGFDNGAVTDVGRAELFPGSAGGLGSGAVWTQTGGQIFGGLGTAVAAAGDVNGDGYGDWLVGTPYLDSGVSNSGEARLYHGSATTASPVTQILAGPVQADARFGIAVASAGDVNGDGYSDVLIGADGYLDTLNQEGRATLHLGTPNALVTTPAVWSYESNTYGGRLGWSVSSAGDVNGDGYSDVAVGRPRAGPGTLHVFHGSANGLPLTPSWTYDSTEASSDQTLGRTVAAAGDVNGDGYGDLVAGDLGYDGGEVDEGRVLVFYGSPSGLPAAPSWSGESDEAGARLGISVSGAGDVNGDGYADVIAGAHFVDGSIVDEGAAFVYLGSPTGLLASWSWRGTGGQAGSLFGWAVSGVGDVNGDGYGDVMVGSRAWSNGEASEGRASLYLGSPTGPSPTPDWTAEPDQANAFFGNMVRPAGDVNGDGFADAAVVAPSYDNGQTDEGRIFVYHGSASGLPAGPSWTYEHNATGEGMTDAATAGDVNADGYGDLIVGSRAYGTERGRAFFFLGSASGLPAGPSVPPWDAGQDDSNFGTSVAAAGDVNGDGFGEVIISADRWTSTFPTEADEGRVFLYSGIAGRRVLARSIRGGAGTLPVEPWGRAYDPDDFKARLNSTSPAGRLRIRVEAEACPPGAAFGSPACVLGLSPAWSDVTATSGGVLDDVSVSGLQPRTLYRWRARTLFAPFSVTAAGITPPPRPAHGPWRRRHAQALEADLRTDQQVVVSFTAASSSVAEAAGSAIVVGELTTSDGQPTLYDVTVQWQTADGTAVGGSDYFITSGTFSWPAGSTNGSTRLGGAALIDDAMDEADEAFTFNLVNPVNAALGAIPSHTVTILDDDPVPSASVGDTLVVEGDTGTTSAVFLVTLSNPSAQVVSVEFTTAPGSAGAGIDFVSASGPLSFPPGTTSRPVAVTVNGDTLPEADEDFSLQLSNPSGAVLADPVATGIIRDDDAPVGDDVRFFAVTARNGKTILEWVYPSGYNEARVRFTSGPGGCAFPSDPEGADPLLGDFTGTAGLQAAAPHDFLNNGWHYCYTIWAKTGPSSWSPGERNRGRPFDDSAGQPEEPVVFAYSTGATAVVPPGQGGAAVYVPSNDRALHAVLRSGPNAGTWPTGAPSWMPWAMGGPAQTRPPVVPTTVVLGSNSVLFVGSQDGNVYAVDAVSGQPKWQTPLLPAGALVQAAPAGLFSRFGAPFDLLFVGTWSSGGNNRFYALDAASGGVVNFFDGGGAPTDVGVVSGGVSVDYATRRVYFTSRRAGRPDTVWAFDASAAGLSLAWSRAPGDVDAAPVLRGGRLYVGTVGGEIRAYDASVGPLEGSEPWSAPFPTLDGSVKGFLFPDRLSSDLFFSTNGKLWSIRDDGGDAGFNWSTTAVPSPSIPVIGRVGGIAYVFVGGGDGRLYQLDAATGLQVTSVRLGDGSARIGPPSLDATSGLVFAGSEAGILYAVQVPLP